jgi:RHS repeat-associated protein
MKRRALRPTYLALLCISLFCAAPDLASQVSNQLNTGFPENGIFRGSDIESVQMNNGGIHVEIPIFSAKGRGLNVASRVVYNSKSWTFRTRCFTSGGGFCEDDVSGDPLGYGSLVFAGAFDYMFHASSRTCQQTQNVFLTIVGGYTLREPDGTKHHFAPDPLVETACVPPHYTSTVYADDGSGWIMLINTSDGSMVSAINKSGLVVRAACDLCATNISASLFVDANGNQMQPSGSCCGTSGLGGTDTLGRTIPANGGYYDSTGTLQTPTLSGNVSVALNTDGLCAFATADTCVPNDGTQLLPTQLQLPNGDVFTFTYAQNGGGELASMTLPTGGQVSWTWGGWGEGGRNLASRTVTSNGVTGTWNYNMGIDGGGIVTDPAHKDTRYTCGSGICSKVEHFDGTADASPLIKTVTTDYAQIVSIVEDTSDNPVGILPIRETTTWNQQNLTMKTETDWDTQVISGVGTISWHNPIEKRVFDWGSNPAQLALLQRTHSSYRHLESDGSSYLAANLADLVTLTQIYDGSGNVLSQTQNSYDGGGLTSTGTCQAPGVPNHDYCNYPSTFLLRGNVTQTSRWVNTTNTWVNTTNTYDDLGNILSTSDPLSHTTTFDYTDSWGGSGCVTAANTRAFPTTVTNAKNQRIKNSYFPCSSLLQSKRDENDIVAGRPGTTYTYDLMNRTLSAQMLDAGNQVLAKTTWSYNDTVLPLSITKTMTASPSPDIVSTVVMDGVGRTAQTIQSDPEGNVASEITYDSFGRVASVTNPHRSVTTTTDGTTQYAYDALGRTTDVIKPDLNTIHTDYAANATTVTDETLRQRRSVNDGLGRLIEVDEPGDPSSGSPANGSIDIGQIKTVQIAGSGAIAASVQITIQGLDRAKTTTIRCPIHAPPGCEPTVITYYDNGKVFITINGHEYDYFYGNSGDSPDSTTSVAQGLALAINADGARVVNASSSAAVLTLTAVTAGTAGNSISYSTGGTWDTATWATGPPFTASPASGTLAGGQNGSAPTTVTDHGTVTISVGSFTSAAVPYGPGTANTTAASVATALAAALSGSGVNASTNGGTVITVTEIAAGASNNGTSVATHPASADPTDFPSPSFTVNPISLSGGADPYPSGLVHPYVTLYSYDGLGNLLCVEQHGNTTGTGCSAAPANDATSPWRIRRFTYDSLSRLLTAKNPEAGQTAYQYDADSNLISKTDARGVNINYSPTGSPIDSLHRVTQKTYSDGTPTVTYQYDTGCCGVTPENPAGHMTAAFAGNTELVFSYDALDRIKTQWDCPPSGIARGFCYVISAQYDATGKITSLTYPDGRVVTSAYSSAGRFLRTDLASFNGTSVNFNYYTVPQSTSATAWGYFPTGAMNRGTYGNGVVETTGYNNRLQISSIADALGGAAFFSKNYAYADGSGHNNGNILTITDTLNGAKTQTFSYDSLNRILTGAQADNAFNLSYSYDPWGNMKESGTSTFQPLFDITNRMVPSAGCTPTPTPFCSDAAGDLLVDNHNHAYAYDGEARIKTVDGTAAAYTYNALGNRVRKDVGTTSTEYFFFAGTVIAELNPATTAWTDYIGYGKRIVKDTSSNGTGAQYYHGDHLGSARVMTDSAGTVISNCTYNPFGEEVGCSPNNTSNHYRFTGKEHDSESGLDDFGARYFSSSMGRWATPDWNARPVTVPYANFGDPQSLNLYLYVRNDPVSHADADGHISNDNGGQSCLDSFMCYVEYQKHMKDNQPSGWFSVTLAFNSGNDSGSDSGSDSQSDTSSSSSSSSSSSGQPPMQNGVAASQTFKTRDEAAKAAEKAALDATVNSGNKYEYGGLIIKNKDGSYTYTIAVTFKNGSHFYPESVSVPKGYTRVADYHTHPHHDKAEGEGMSIGDQNHADTYHRASYEADTYSRNMYRYVPGVSEAKPNEWCCGVIGDFVAHIPQ